MRNMLLAATAAIAFAGSADALTFFSLGAKNHQDPGLQSYEQFIATFDGGAGDVVVPTDLTNYAYVTGSSPGYSAAPDGDTSRYMNLGTGGSATFALAPSTHTVSVYLGSIDTYNHIDLLRADGSIYSTISGGMMPPANGDWTDRATNRRLYMSFASADAVSALRFRSDGVAFEFDSLAASSVRFNLSNGPTQRESMPAVPEPASWAMMITGFGLVGGVMRRRQRTRVSFG